VSEIDVEALDRALERAMANPMPPDLFGQVSDEIEPHCMNEGIKHRTVMEGIEIAYPLIVADELQRLVDRAFPDGEDSDYHYGCEALLDHLQARIAQLRPTEETA
jgi:hypothetical protein